MLRAILCVALLAVTSSLMAAEHTTDSLDTVKEQLAKNDAVLLDVREKGEWDKAHLRDAKLVPLSQLKKAATDDQVRQELTKGLSKDRIIYCHCAKGIRALSAGALLEKWGYDVRPLSVGYDELREAGFPQAAN